MLKYGCSYGFIVRTITVLILLAFYSPAQELKPAAAYLFNNNAFDEVKKSKAKLVGVSYTRDRFNNENFAVYLFGSQSSYINLGDYKWLKSRMASISLWVRMESEIWAGRGQKINPILLTKRTKEDDFYESFALYYSLEGKVAAASTTQDSLKQINIMYGDFKRFNWQHFVLTFDDSYLSFYADGKLIGKLVKGFSTEYNDSDSVLVGVTGNQKNHRFFNGAIDDIQFFDRVLTQQEVNLLYRAPNPNKIKNMLRTALLALGFIALIALIYVYIRYRLSLTLKREKQNLELVNLQLETELRVNRALMNPHFVFNSLNALQNFILSGENEVANNYLVKFSKLMRKILESNMSEVITLEQEIALLTGYLEIEDLRFEENISTALIVSSGIVPSAIQIPIMMIQPFVENAIWHGLLKKKGEKALKISFALREKIYLECIIEDNGVGRNPDKKMQNGRNSLATHFVMQRLDLLNRINGLDCGLQIIDKKNNQGTIVKITLPVLNKKA